MPHAFKFKVKLVEKDKYSKSPKVTPTVLIINRKHIECPITRPSFVAFNGISCIQLKTPVKKADKDKR